MTLGAYLRAKREKKGMPLQEVADAVNSLRRDEGDSYDFTRQQLSNIELGKETVHILTLHHLMRVLRGSYSRAMKLLAEDMVAGRIGPRARVKTTRSTQ